MNDFKLKKLDQKAYRKEFERRLGDLSLSYQNPSKNSYLLRISETGRTNRVKLIFSGETDLGTYGSKNGNFVQSIGRFKFGISANQDDSELYVFVFGNKDLQRTDFIIIPLHELRKRLVMKTRNSFSMNRISVVFWLFDDRFLYDCTRVSAEWEWYFLSKGLYGRMVDGSKRDYSNYLNAWDGLINV